MMMTLDDYTDILVAAMNEGKNNPKETAKAFKELGVKAERSANELKSILKWGNKEAGKASK